MKQDQYPRIIERNDLVTTKWIRVVAKDIELHDSISTQTYYSVAQADYVTVLAQTPDGQIPIVRQYRHAVEVYTWELPSGLLEDGETPEEACQRELKEEAGVNSVRLTLLGSFFADCGRLSNKIHVFHAETSHVTDTFVPEPGMEVRFVTLRELHEMARSEKLMNVSTLATLMLYEWWAGSAGPKD